MNEVFWAAILTIFRPGAPGETSSAFTAVRYSSEAACVASVLKDQPAGPMRTTDGRWIVQSCVRVDPDAYLGTSDGERINWKPGVDVQKVSKALCDAANKAGDKALLQSCDESRQ